MNLSVEDEVSLAEAAVILIGIFLTWLVYRKTATESGPSFHEAAPASVGPRVPGQQRGE